MNVLKKVWTGLDGMMEGLAGLVRPKAQKYEQLPGRNDPCACGSGKKFKKCCEEKRLRELRANQPLPGGQRRM